jgi:hypothetical protein
MRVESIKGDRARVERELVVKVASLVDKSIELAIPITIRQQLVLSNLCGSEKRLVINSSCRFAAILDFAAPPRVTADNDGHK